MRVKVRPLRKEGRLIIGRDDPKSPGFAGVLTVDETRDTAANRTLVRARLTGVTAGTNTDVLPELLDARLLWAQENKLRVVGFERIGNDKTEYSQTWSVEVVAC
jgi:hypothetical protein